MAKRGGIGSAGVLVLLVLLVLLFSPAAGSAEVKKPLEPSKKDKCPVCGMFVYKYPDWLAEIVFKDGSAIFFDGPKDLFKYYFRMRDYTPQKSPKDIAAVYVKEYYDLTLMDARKAFFVGGSNVYGPMGHELIPLATAEDARTFKNDHDGRRVFTFEEITSELVKELDLGPRGWSRMGPR